MRGQQENSAQLHFLSRFVLASFVCLVGSPLFLCSRGLPRSLLAKTFGVALAKTGRCLGPLGVDETQSSRRIHLVTDHTASQYCPWYKRSPDSRAVFARCASRRSS